MPPADEQCPCSAVRRDLRWGAKWDRGVVLILGPYLCPQPSHVHGQEASGAASLIPHTAGVQETPQEAASYGWSGVGRAGSPPMGSLLKVSWSQKVSSHLYTAPCERSAVLRRNSHRWHGLWELIRAESRLSLTFVSSRWVCPSTQHFEYFARTWKSALLLPPSYLKHPPGQGEMLLPFLQPSCTTSRQAVPSVLLAPGKTITSTCSILQPWPASLLILQSTHPAEKAELPDATQVPGQHLHRKQLLHWHPWTAGRMDACQSSRARNKYTTTEKA